jgi:hypothetical protein
MTTVYDQSAILAGTNDGGGNGATNLRNVLAASLLSAATGTQCQLTFLFGNTEGTETPAIDTVYFGQKGASSPDFAGDQVQVFFGGSATMNGSASGVVVSDVFTLPQTWDNTKDYVVSWYTHTGQQGTVSFAALTGAVLWGSSVGPPQTNQAGSNSLTSPTNIVTNAAFLEKIDITAATGTPTLPLTIGTSISKRRVISGY